MTTYSKLTYTDIYVFTFWYLYMRLYFAFAHLLHKYILMSNYGDDLYSNVCLAGKYISMSYRHLHYLFIY